MELCVISVARGSSIINIGQRELHKRVARSAEGSQTIEKGYHKPKWKTIERADQTTSRRSKYNERRMVESIISSALHGIDQRPLRTT